MFDKYKESQFIAYNLLKNSVNNNKLSHAYLIDLNNNDEGFDFIISFIKFILCNNINNKDCNLCSLCNRIDNGNYTELKIIEAINNVIKKDQLLELQNELSMTSIEGNYRFYIIKDCDKMNKQAANSLLKFLEEPQEGIIAFLLTNNFNRLLSTIVSRCQIIRLENNVILGNDNSYENVGMIYCDNSKDYDEFISDENKRNIFNCVLDFIEYYEENGLDYLLYSKNRWFKYIKNREDSVFAYFLLIYFYSDVMMKKMGYEKYVFCSNVDLMESIISYNSVEKLIDKIEASRYAYEMTLKNLNLNLLFDDYVFRLGGY